MANEDRLRGYTKEKFKRTHPHARLEHRIIDSAAFADLSGSAIRLLMILLRQISYEQNNGHLQATWSYCKHRGFNSQNTLSKAIGDLIAHGLIYRTRSRGANKQWARYAVTWLPISKSRELLFLHGFKADAWRDWKKLPEKTEGNRLQKQDLSNGFSSSIERN
jgi:hypothetical protein